MPTVLRWRGYRFYFYSADGVEPMHIHIRKDENEAKFWLTPVSLANSYGFSDNDLKELEKKVYTARKDFIDAWVTYFG